jgi:hypothetical protein
MAAKQRHGAIVGRRFGEDDVTVLQHLQAEKLDQLQRSVSRENAVNAHALPAGQPFPEWLKAERRAVLQHRRSFRPERCHRRVDHVVDLK